MSGKQIINLVRGLTSPYPGAFFWLNNNKVIIHKAYVPELEYCGIPGRYVGIRDGHPIIIAKDKGIAIESYSIIGSDESCFPPAYGVDLNNE
tara:strand:+ start:1966 stop:2241 length:276 start_codon:yes stop_codon:yes gene_type:complete